MTSVMVRFGLSVLEISKLNPRRTQYRVGDVVCVAPRWDKAVDRNAKYVCRPREVNTGGPQTGRYIASQNVSNFGVPGVGQGRDLDEYAAVALGSI